LHLNVLLTVFFLVGNAHRPPGRCAVVADVPALALLAAGMIDLAKQLVRQLSMDAFMSVDASLTRSVGPFVQTVTSATWLSAIEGFFSTRSSSSTSASACSWRSSFRIFSSAYRRIVSLTSWFLPFT